MLYPTGISIIYAKQKGPRSRPFLNSARPTRLNGLGDPPFQLAFGRRPDLRRFELAALEKHQRRYAANAVGSGGVGILIDVELGDRALALHFRSYFLKRGADHLAGAAPFGPEIDDDGALCTLYLG